MTVCFITNKMRYCTICDSRITERAYKKHCDKHELDRIAKIMSAIMRNAENHTAYASYKLGSNEDALMTESDAFSAVDNAIDDQSNDEDESARQLKRKKK